MTPTDESRRAAVAAAGLVFAVATPAIYVGQRLYDHARGRGGDPSLVVAAAHAGYSWRAAIAVWFGGLCALLAFVASRRSGRGPGLAAARGLAVACVVVSVASAILAWRFP